MNKLSLTYKILFTVLLGIILSIALSHIHIEFLWYQQFGLKSILLKKWFIQSILLSISLLITITLLLWQHKWIKKDNRNEINTHNKSLKGLNYSLSLLLCFTTISLTLKLLLNIAKLSSGEPFALISWWTAPINYDLLGLNQFLFTFIIVSITCFFKKGFLLLQLYGSILYCITIVKGWGLWSIALYSQNTGIKEPLYGSDITFGIARFPGITLFTFLVFLLLFLTLSTSLWAYLTKANRKSDWSAPYLSDKLRNHLRPIAICTLSSGLLMLWLSRHQFLWSERGIITGATWLDVNFSIPLRTATCLFLLLFLVSIYPFKSRYKNRSRVLSGIFLLLSLALEFIFSPVLQWIIVKPRELTLESKYIERAIKSTRRAFQLDSIQTRLISPNQELTKKDIELGESTLKNVRLWDSQPLLNTNRQLQQLRLYYRFSNVAVDRYKLLPETDERQQVMITARELDQDELPTSSKTWLNSHFVFTHGYGFTVSPVNTRAKDGLPEYFISDLGSSTKIQGNAALGITKDNVIRSIPIGRSAIYYGMLPYTYAIAPSKIKELDYPEGDKNIFNHYQGTGGISLSSVLERLSASIYLREPRLLNTGSLTKDSRLLIRREVRERIRTLAPFLQLTSDPYLVSVDTNESLNQDAGQSSSKQYQYWIVEGYTSSYTYPYASALPNGSNLRYIRNSVKAVVDAYNGHITLYISEPDDPLINGWEKLFPELFKGLDEMPSSLKEHLRVPTDLFDLQVQQLLRYHVTNPQTFYNGDDIWQVPKELYGKSVIPVKPYHITAQLGPNENSEFLLLQPLSPLGRPNLSAWLAARNDGDHYGQLVLLRFPSETSIFGPEQIQALINQNPAISQQFSLWDRAGSEVIQGNLIVLPIGNSLLYVEPVYIKATRGGLPTLTRIVVSDGKSIVMEESLSKALIKLLELK